MSAGRTQYHGVDLSTTPLSRTISVPFRLFVCHSVLFLVRVRVEGRLGVSQCRNDSGSNDM